MLRLSDFRGVVSDKVIYDIYYKAKSLQRKSIVHLNATYQGGGVAEILYSLVLLMNDVGINTEWRVLKGDSEFFNITKSFHNALQGADFNFTEEMQEVYLNNNNHFAQFNDLYHDCVIIHDPQPLSLIDSYKKRAPWIWRCHIDLTDPHARLWYFLKDFILKYDDMIVSSSNYTKSDIPIRQKIIAPAINPLDSKNYEMTDEGVRLYIDKANIPTDKPIITQVSRLDPWKDPEGVIDVFERVK
ncbi:MAG: glycosyl transferase family 1, partial [bacterium]